MVCDIYRLFPDGGESPIEHIASAPLHSHELLPLQRFKSLYKIFHQWIRTKLKVCFQLFPATNCSPTTDIHTCLSKRTLSSNLRFQQGDMCQFQERKYALSIFRYRLYITLNERNEYNVLSSRTRHLNAIKFLSSSVLTDSLPGCDMMSLVN